ncbi:IS3 family transposase [Agrobacterium salinitolerans]|nr:IS3 family transposase [Agrobacterium salinitolerans]
MGDVVSSGVRSACRHFIWCTTSFDTHRGVSPRKQALRSGKVVGIVSANTWRKVTGHPYEAEHATRLHVEWCPDLIDRTGLTTTNQTEPLIRAVMFELRRSIAPSAVIEIANTLPALERGILLAEWSLEYEPDPPPSAGDFHRRVYEKVKGHHSPPESLISDVFCFELKSCLRINRQFKAPAPNRLWVSDFTYVATWQGFVYVAFVIDVFARRIVGWRASRTAHASFVLDALEQALHDRRPVHGGGLVHHSDRGVQYVSIRYSARLAEAGIEPSVGSVGDSYDNALAETINGLYKAEVIHRRGPWRNFEAVEFATLEWVNWFNHRRLLEPIGNIPPAEAEERYYAMLDEPAMAA